MRNHLLYLDSVKSEKRNVFDVNAETVDRYRFCKGQIYIKKKKESDIKKNIM